MDKKFFLALVLAGVSLLAIALPVLVVRGDIQLVEFHTSCIGSLIWFALVFAGILLADYMRP